MSQWQPRHDPRRPAGQPPATPPQWQQRGYPASKPPMSSLPPTAAQTGRPEWQQPQYPPQQQPPQQPRKPRGGLAFLGCGGLGAVAVLIAVLVSSNSSSSSAPPAAQTQAAPASGSAAPPSASCKLKTTFDYIVRDDLPGASVQAQEIGNVDLANCTSSLADFAATAGQADGECTTIALASKNPGYDVNAVPAPPLKDVIESAGPGC